MRSHNCHSVSFASSMASALCTEQELRCSICQHVFTNPTSLPCGHNYCLDCIESYWDTRTSCECPICRKVFKPQPDLRVNWVLQNITEEFKRSCVLMLVAPQSLSCSQFLIINTIFILFHFKGLLDTNQVHQPCTTDQSLTVSSARTQLHQANCLSLVGSCPVEKFRPLFCGTKRRPGARAPHAHVPAPRSPLSPRGIFAGQTGEQFA